VSAYIAALTAAGATVAVGLVAMARSSAQPSSPALQPMVRPIEALDQFEARCVAERRATLHVRFAMGGVMCLDCRRRITTQNTQGDQ